MTTLTRRQEFLEKYHVYLKFLIQRLRSWTQTETEAEEIATKALHRYERRMSKSRWRKKVKSVEAYLWTITRHLLMDIKKAGKAAPHVQYEDAGKEVSWKISDNGQQAKQMVEKAHYDRLFTRKEDFLVKGFSQYELRILKLHYEDLSGEEISATVGKDLETVRKDVKRVVARFKARVRIMARGKALDDLIF